jgi:hypothetical protein
VPGSIGGLSFEAKTPKPASMPLARSLSVERSRYTPSPIVRRTCKPLVSDSSLSSSLVVDNLLPVEASTSSLEVSSSLGKNPDEELDEGLVEEQEAPAIGIVGMEGMVVSKGIRAMDSPLELPSAAA